MKQECHTLTRGAGGNRKEEKILIYLSLDL
jgi:hypothetical protein